MTVLTLIFRDCGFAGRENAFLGDWLVGAVEPPGVSGMRALWSFYLDARHRKINQPAASLEAARDQVTGEVDTMLRSMGIVGRTDRGVVALVDGRRQARPATTRRLA